MGADMEVALESTNLRRLDIERKHVWGRQIIHWTKFAAHMNPTLSKFSLPLQRKVSINRAYGDYRRTEREAEQELTKLIQCNRIRARSRLRYAKVLTGNEI